MIPSSNFIHINNIPYKTPLRPRFNDLLKYPAGGTMSELGGASKGLTLEAEDGGVHALGDAGVEVGLARQPGRREPTGGGLYRRRGNDDKRGSNGWINVGGSPVKTHTKETP